jgi:hypothetical protein
MIENPYTLLQLFLIAFFASCQNHFRNKLVSILCPFYGKQQATAEYAVDPVYFMKFGEK